LFIATAFGAGAFLVTSPCLMFECKEIQTAEALQNSFQQLASNANSEDELVQMQKRLESATVALKAIPPWSPRHQEAKKLTIDLSGKSEQVSQVVKGFAAANSALQKTQTPANSLEELQLRQQMWRHAITPLETINSNSDLHGLVQQQLSLYRLRLQTVNQLLITEERWLKKLAASKAVANEAMKREAVAKTAEDWQKVLSTWQVVVNALTPIPQTSSSYQEAQKLLAEYQPQLSKVRERSTKQLFAAQTYNQAISAAEQAKSYEQQNQWQAAVTQWQQALTTAQQIRSDNPYYQKAQTLIEPFSISLRQAQAQMQPRTDENKTRTDLEKTCAGDVRICNFILDDKGITVRITPEYEQTLQTSLVNASNTGDGEAVNNVTLHLKVLQEAFEVISENSNLPLLVYDAKGAVIHRRT
jgi:tetratricopeptide (TPR) repeat protein